MCAGKKRMDIDVEKNQIEQQLCKQREGVEGVLTKGFIVRKDPTDKI